jgi:hypothetical protein
VVCACCYLTWFLNTADLHTKSYCIRAIIGATWLLVNAQWLAWETLPYIHMRNCSFGSVGGVNGNEVSLFVPPVASQPLTVVTLCHLLLMLQPGSSIFPSLVWQQQLQAPDFHTLRVSSRLWPHVCDALRSSFSTSNLQKGTAASVRLDQQQLKINEEFQVTHNNSEVTDRHWLLLNNFKPSTTYASWQFIIKFSLQQTSYYKLYL